MREILIMTLVYGAYVVLDLIPLIKDKKVFRVYIAIFAFSYLLLCLSSFDVMIPSPATPIKLIISRLFNV